MYFRVAALAIFIFSSGICSTILAEELKPSCSDLKKLIHVESAELSQMEAVHNAINTEDCCSVHNLALLKETILDPIDPLNSAISVGKLFDSGVGVTDNFARWSKTALANLRNRVLLAEVAVEDVAAAGETARVVQEGGSAIGSALLKSVGYFAMLAGVIDTAILIADGIQRIENAGDFIEMKDLMIQETSLTLLNLRISLARTADLIHKAACDPREFDEKVPISAAEHLGLAAAANALSHSKAMNKHENGNVFSKLFGAGDLCARFGDFDEERDQSPWVIESACGKSADILERIMNKASRSGSSLSQASRPATDLIERERRDILQRCNLEVCRKCFKRPVEQGFRTRAFLEIQLPKCDRMFGTSKTAKLQAEKTANEKVVCYVNALCSYGDASDTVHVSVLGLKRKECPGTDEPRFQASYRHTPRVAQPVWEACSEKAKNHGSKLKDVVYLEASRRTAGDQEEYGSPSGNDQDPRGPIVSCNCGTFCAAQDPSKPDYMAFERMALSWKFSPEDCDEPGKHVLEKFDKPFCGHGDGPKKLSCRLVSSNDPVEGKCDYADGENVKIDWVSQLGIRGEEIQMEKMIEACRSENKSVSFCENRHQLFRVTFGAREYATNRWACRNSDGSFDVRGGPSDDPFTEKAPGKELTVRTFVPANPPPLISREKEKDH